MMIDYKQFIEFFDYLLEHCTENIVMSDEVKKCYDMLKEQGLAQAKKPILTDTGVLILEYLQSHDDIKNIKTKDIADGMNVSSRKISGAMRKLFDDNFVDKFGQNPVVYNLTEKGKNFNIKEYKENLENGKD